MARALAFGVALIASSISCGVADAQVGQEGHKPSAYLAPASVPPLSASDAKIFAALSEGTKFEFADTAFSDVVDYIKQKHEIEVQLDNKGLADAAVDPSTPVTRSVDGISLRSALRLILEDLDLTYVIQDEVLKITSKEKADEILTTRIYRVDDLLKRRVTIRELIDVVVATVQPDSWDESGGPGSIMPLAGVLVVSQKLDCHEETADLLAALRLQLPKPAAAGDEEAASEDIPRADRYRVVIYPLSRISNEDAIKAVTTLVEPASWQGQGGTATVCAVTQTLPPVSGNAENKPTEYRVLAVRQTADIQARVRSLLRRLDPQIGYSPGFMRIREACGVSARKGGNQLRQPFSYRSRLPS
jgi:hypothetical protein